MLASILWSKAASSGSDGQRLGSGRLRAPCGDGTLWGAEQHENGTQWHFIPPRRVQPALGLHPQDITGPELVRGPASHGSNPAGFQAPVEGLSRAEQLLYLPSEMQSGAGDGRKADGGGTGPTPPRGTALRFSWQGATGGREPSLCTHGVRHHHHINNERAAPSKLFAPAPARAQNAEEVREPHPKQLQGERSRCPAGGSSAGLLSWGDKITCQVPPLPGHSPCWEFGYWGVPE